MCHYSAPHALLPRRPSSQGATPPSCLTGSEPSPSTFSRTQSWALPSASPHSESAPFSPALCHYLGLGFPCLPGEGPPKRTAYLVLYPLALILILSSPDKRIFLNDKHNHVPPLLQIPQWLPNACRLQSNLSACVFTGLSGKISPFMGT